MEPENMDEKTEKLPAEIDEARLAEEARASDHGEAYRSMGAVGDSRIGVGARVDAEGDASYFIEVLFPLSPGPSVDLERLEGTLEVMRTLKAEGFSIALQDDSFSCELEISGGGLQESYERIIKLLR